MSEVFVFLLVVVVLLFIFGVANNRDADPSGRTLTKDLGDGIVSPAFFDSEFGSSSHSHSAHCDHHAPADTASHQGGFDASHFGAGGGHH